MPETATKLVAGILILTVVFVNCVSVRATTGIVTVFGVGKVLSLVIIIVGGIVRLAQGVYSIAICGKQTCLKTIMGNLLEITLK